MIYIFHSFTFFDASPFSKFYLEIDNQSPGRIGRWIGWQIVRSYMNYYPHNKLKDICNKLLISLGIENAIAKEVADCLIQTSLRGIDSHGIRLLPHYTRVAKSGRINKEPN